MHACGHSTLQLWGSSWNLLEHRTCGCHLWRNSPHASVWDGRQAPPPCSPLTRSPTRSTHTRYSHAPQHPRWFYPSRVRVCHTQVGDEILSVDDVIVYNGQESILSVLNEHGRTYQQQLHRVIDVCARRKLAADSAPARPAPPKLAMMMLAAKAREVDAAADDAPECCGCLGAWLAGRTASERAQRLLYLLCGLVCLLAVLLAVLFALLMALLRRSALLTAAHGSLAASATIGRTDTVHHVQMHYIYTNRTVYAYHYNPPLPPPPPFAIIVDFGTPELAERASQYLAKQPAAALKRAGLSLVSGVAGPAAAGQQAAVGMGAVRWGSGVQASVVGAGLRLEASSAMSVGELQAKLREVTGMEAAAQVLTYGGTQLATSSAQTLGDAGVRSGDHLNLAPFTVRIALPASLRGMYGDAITLTTSPLASVRELKRVLQKRTGLTIAEMTLVFGGATLADDVMLQRAGVVSGDTLDLSLPAYVIHIDMPAWLEPKHGDFSRMYVTSAMTTAELHGEVATLTGLKRAQQQLTFKQRLLAPSEETLAQLGIESHDTISLQYLGNDGVADTTLHHTAMQLTYATQLSLKCTDSAEAVRGTPRAARAQAAAPAASQRGSSARS